MTWIILQFLFLAMPAVIASALYKSNRRFMDGFYKRLVHGDKARRFYVRMLLIMLLLYHYVYTNGHPGEFGVVFSTIVCVALASFKRTDRWLRYLLDRPRAFAIHAFVAVVIACIPHLHTLAVTVTFVLLAALFYPSARIMSEWKEYNIYRIYEWVKNPETFAESYHDNRHTKLPHEADNNDPIDPNNFHNDKSSKKESK